MQYITDKKIGKHIHMNKYIASLLIFISGICCAGEQTGQIVDLRVSAYKTFNPTHVKLSGTWSGAPSCATIGFWAIDTETPTGKNVLATLLAAQAAGKNVRIWGSNQCTLRGDMETATQVGVN
jgi:hypothetical protein